MIGIGKWKCDKCGWEGDYPITYNPHDYEDGGYKACPEGCTGNIDGGGNLIDDEPTAVAMNWNHPDTQLRFVKALEAISRGGR